MLYPPELVAENFGIESTLGIAYRWSYWSGCIYVLVGLSPNEMYEVLSLFFSCLCKSIWLSENLLIRLYKNGSVLLMTPPWWHYLCPSSNNFIICDPFLITLSMSPSMTLIVNPSPNDVNDVCGCIPVLHSATCTMEQIKFFFFFKFLFDSSCSIIMYWRFIILCDYPNRQVLLQIYNLNFVSRGLCGWTNS